MKAFEFQTSLTANRTIDLPSDLQAQLEPGSAVRVILLFPAPTESNDWNRLTAEQFLKGYAESDSIYDRL